MPIVVNNLAMVARFDFLSLTDSRRQSESTLVQRQITALTCDKSLQQVPIGVPGNPLKLASPTQLIQFKCSGLISVKRMIINMSESATNRNYDALKFAETQVERLLARNLRALLESRKMQT